MDNQGVFVEWLDDGAIVIFRAETDDNEAVDVWADFITTIAAERPNDIAFIHDFSSISPTVTPYIRQKVKEINVEPNQGYVAVVLSRSVISMMVRFFVNNEVVHLQPDVEHRIFFDRDQAIDWMRHKLEERVEEASISIVE